MRERNILTEALIKVFYAILGTYLLKQQTKKTFVGHKVRTDKRSATKSSL